MPEIDPKRQKIVIEVEEETPKPPRGEEATPLGMLPNYIRRPMILRRPVAPIGDYINFYDLGQYLIEEEYRDLDYAAIPTASFSVNRSSPSWFVEIIKIALSKFTPMDWANFRARLFVPPIETWKNYYRQIPFEVFPPYSPNIRSKTGAFQTVSPSLASNNIEVFGIRWDEGAGLAYSGLTAIDLASVPAYYNFKTNDPANFKITLTPNSTDPAAPFVMGGAINAYLVPRIGLAITTCQKTVTDTPGGNTHQVVTDDSLNYFYRATPRNYFPTFIDPSITATNQPNDTGGLFSAYVEWMRSQAGARACRIERDFLFIGGSGAHSTSIFEGAISPGGFPPKDAYFTRYLLRRTNDTLNLRIVEPVNFPTDFNTDFFDNPSSPPLVGVLEKGGSFYYIWYVGSNFVGANANAFPSAGGFRFNYKDTI